jgi:hypothetical protein
VIVTANQTNVFINTLQFDIGSMQYTLKQGNVQLPNTGLIRNYTLGQVSGDSLMLGTTGGEVCVFSISSRIYRAAMPLSSNGIMALAIVGDNIYVGGGDGKVKKLNTSSGRWTLTHEA